MAYKVRTRICQVCGKPMTGRIRPAGFVRCIDCGVKAAVKCMTEMQNKSGPTYDRWQQAMMRRFSQPH